MVHAPRVGMVNGLVEEKRANNLELSVICTYPRNDIRKRGPPVFVFSGLPGPVSFQTALLD